jgi:ABC-2 type transport system ATP-binding protein
VVLTLGGDADKVQEAAQKEPYVHKTTIDGGDLRLSVDDGGQDAPLLMKLAGDLGVKVGSVAIQKQSLEDVFIHHTGRSIRDEETRKVSMFLGAGVPQKLGR